MASCLLILTAGNAAGLYTEKWLRWARASGQVAGVQDGRLRVWLYLRTSTSHQWKSQEAADDDSRGHTIDSHLSDFVVTSFCPGPAQDQCQPLQEFGEWIWGARKSHDLANMAQSDPLCNNKKKTDPKQSITMIQCLLKKLFTNRKLRVCKYLIFV